MPDPAPASAAPEGTGAPTVTVTPQPTTTAGGDDNAGLLAELEAELAGKDGAPAAGTGSGDAAAAPADTAAEGETPDAPADEPTGEATAEDDEPADDQPLEDEDLEDDDPAVDPDEGDPAIAAEADKDPALKARLDAVRRTEERQRARLANERHAFDQERQQFISERGQALQKLQQFDQLVARAKYDLPSVVRALGIEPADFEYHAQSLMAHSPKFANDEKYRAAAERAMREREATDRAAANERKLADIEAKLQAKEQQELANREIDGHFTRAMRKVSDATPITQQLIKNAPKAARAALMATAQELMQKQNLERLPPIATILAEQEKKEIRAARLRGFKPGTKPAATAANGAAGTKPATADAAKPTGQASPAKPGKQPAAATPTPAVSAPAATPAAAPVNPGHIPTRDELLAELANGAAN